MTSSIHRSSLPRPTITSVAFTEARREADDIRKRWTTLRQDLSRESELLWPLVGDTALEPVEAAPLQSLLETLATLTADAPPAPLPDLMEAVIPALDASLDRERITQVRLTDRIAALKQQGDEIPRKLDDLWDELGGAGLQNGAG